MNDRIFTTEEIREFGAKTTAKEKARAGLVRTEAGRALIARSRTVVTGPDRSIITIVDGDVLLDILAIETEPPAHP